MSVAAVDGVQCVTTYNLKQLCLDHFVEVYDPVIGDSYRKQCVIDEESCVLEILDTGGQEGYYEYYHTALRDQLIRDGEGFVLVYSRTSRYSFIRTKGFHQQVAIAKDSLDPPPVVLVGNKCDCITEREVSTQEGLALADELECGYVETSAKNRMNVEKAFYDVVRMLRWQRMPPPFLG